MLNSKGKLINQVITQGHAIILCENGGGLNSNQISLIPEFLLLTLYMISF